MVTVTNERKKIVLATALLEEALERAQVLIVEGERWHAIGPVPYRAQGDFGVEDAKGMAHCPIVDVSPIQEEQEETMGMIMRACVDDRMGVFNLSGLVTGLEALGAVITQDQ